MLSWRCMNPISTESNPWEPCTPGQDSNAPSLWHPCLLFWCFLCSVGGRFGANTRPNHHESQTHPTNSTISANYTGQTYAKCSLAPPMRTSPVPRSKAFGNTPSPPRHPYRLPWAYLVDAYFLCFLGFALKLPRGTNLSIAPNRQFSDPSLSSASPHPPSPSTPWCLCESFPFFWCSQGKAHFNSFQ